MDTSSIKFRLSMLMLVLYTSFKWNGLRSRSPSIKTRFSSHVPPRTLISLLFSLFEVTPGIIFRVNGICCIFLAFKVLFPVLLICLSSSSVFIPTIVTAGRLRVIGVRYISGIFKSKRCTSIVFVAMR